MARGEGGDREEITRLRRQVAELSERLREAERHCREREERQAVLLRDVEQANRAKVAFFSNMSHEIRTPMNAIVGFTQLMLATELTEKQRHYMRSVAHGSETLMRLIGDLFDLSKLEAGTLKLDYSCFMLDEMLRRLDRLVSPMAERKGIQFRIDVADDVPRALVGDGGRVYQMISGLVENGVKFTERGEVVLRVSCGAGRADSDGEGVAARVLLRVEVEDNGIGMDEALQQRLFEPFTLGDDSLTRRQGGSGLGLVLCHRLLMLMGGSISVKSSPGSGSLFTLEIPLLSAEGEVTHGDRFRKSRKVMVVDDEREVAAFIRETLLRAGYGRVDCLGDAEEALRALRQDAANDPYHLVVMDWRLPGMDGLAACTLITKDELLAAALPARLVISGFHPDREITGTPPYDAILRKPFSAAALLDAVSDLVAAGGGSPRQENGVDAGHGREEEARGTLVGCRVLLVDDREINRQVVGEVLRDWDMEVVEAENGAQALKVLQDCPVDLVLMDMMMPVMDGLEATRLIRQCRGLAHLPVVAMTGNSGAEDHRRCLDAGMTDILLKPIDFNQLEPRMRVWLQREGGTAEAARPLSEKNGMDASPISRSDGDDLPDLCPAIEARSCDRALRALDGNLALYRRMMIDFPREYGCFCGQLRDALRRGDDALAQRLAHSVKSAAASLGAERVVRYAAQVESSLRDGAHPDDTLLSRLDAAMEELLQVLRHAASEGDGVVCAEVEGDRLSGDEIGAQILELEKALHLGEQRAMAMLESLMPHLRRCDAERAEHLYRLVDGFDFEKAVDLLRAFDPAFCSESEAGG